MKDKERMKLCLIKAEGRKVRKGKYVCARDFG